MLQNGSANCRSRDSLWSRGGGISADLSGGRGIRHYSHRFRVPRSYSHRNTKHPPTPTPPNSYTKNPGSRLLDPIFSGRPSGGIYLHYSFVIKSTFINIFRCVLCNCDPMGIRNRSAIQHTIGLILPPKAAKKKIWNGFGAFRLICT